MGFGRQLCIGLCIVIVILIIPTFSKTPNPPNITPPPFRKTSTNPTATTGTISTPRTTSKTTTSTITTQSTTSTRTTSKTTSKTTPPTTPTPSTTTTTTSPSATTATSTPNKTTPSTTSTTTTPSTTIATSSPNKTTPYTTSTTTKPSTTTSTSTPTSTTPSTTSTTTTPSSTTATSTPTTTTTSTTSITKPPSTTTETSTPTSTTPSSTLTTTTPSTTTTTSTPSSTTSSTTSTTTTSSTTAATSTPTSTTPSTTSTTKTPLTTTATSTPTSTTPSTTSTTTMPSTTTATSTPTTTSPLPASTSKYPEYPPDIDRAVFVLELVFVFDGDFDYIIDNGKTDDVKHFYEERLKVLFKTTKSLRNLTVRQIMEGSIILETETQFSVADIQEENTNLTNIVEAAQKDVEDGDTDLNFESMTIDKSRTSEKLEEAATEAVGLLDYCDAVGTCPSSYECIYRSLKKPVPVCVHKCTVMNECGSRAECYFDNLKGLISCRCRDSGKYAQDDSDCEEEFEWTIDVILEVVFGFIGSCIVPVAEIIMACLLCGEEKKKRKYEAAKEDKMEAQSQSIVQTDSRSMSCGRKFCNGNIWLLLFFIMGLPLFFIIFLPCIVLILFSFCNDTVKTIRRNLLNYLLLPVTCLKNMLEFEAIKKENFELF